ncbi:MAG: hypothetical protein LRY41_03245 [Candidatus Pacebacteria bacterium]|nr:hypothetical protein [Candidatus Paceibacterota bacterium]MCD8508044.1 hypothetical protein [Candidatus Paceibacterota bacterium]MCD8528310.1 hypothetical protein [Candidatus Paceibacterota bacterium]MCD8563825.1 hypothetical protein [Candidatus Paceibacterota bacterium]
MKITSEIKKGEKSTVDIIAEISYADFEPYYDRALDQLGKDVELKGFRKGQAPREILEKTLGDMRILDEMAHMAVADAYPLLLEEHKLDPLGRPMVNITKLAKGNPLGFTITTAVVPDINLPDYKSIARAEMAKPTDTEVTETEVADAILQIQKMRAQNDAITAGVDPKEAKDAEIKDLDDEYVKTLGDFTDVADFTHKLTENLKAEKENKAYEKTQLAIADALIEATQADVPDVLVDFELQKMMAQMEYDIAMTGMAFDEYLKAIEKTRDDMKKDWHESATKRALMNLIIEKIAHQEKLHPTDEQVENDAQKILEQYKDMKDIDPNNVRAYVASLLTNQNVFTFFAAQK